MKEKTKERLFVGLTALKLAQGINYTRRVRSGKSIIGASIGIAVADILDGFVPRQLDADSPARRITDSLTDAGIIAGGLISTYQKHPEARRYVVALAAREIFVAAGWAVDLATSRQVKQGDSFHRLQSISAWAFGLAAHHGSEKMMRNTGRAAVAVNAAIAYDYYKAWKDPGRTRILDSGIAEIPGFYDARKALHDIKNAPPQLEAGTPISPQLHDGEVINLREFTGEGELPPGTFRAAPEDG